MDFNRAHFKLYLTKDVQNSIFLLNLSDFRQILDATEPKIYVFIAFHIYNVYELHYCVICDFAEIYLAFTLINEKVPEIQNHIFLELCLRTLSLQF